MRGAVAANRRTLRSDARTDVEWAQLWRRDVNRLLKSDVEGASAPLAQQHVERVFTHAH